jgi:hypothetical protein
MNKKTATIDLKGKSYATVPARIKEFREANPNGLIETKPELQTDGTYIFTARILKDKSNLSSGEATGHSIGKVTADKAFEKLETIAIGRALAILGYMASGEIASSEEMEEFNKAKLERHEQQVSEIIDKLKKAKNLAELQKIFVDSPVKSNSDVIRVKDEMKIILK